MRVQLLPDRGGPVTDSGRYRILDSLRGIALLGICLANFPEFALYTFQKKEVTDAMSTAGIDHVIKYLQYIFIDGKFYTMFSVLFGTGFSIIMSRAMQKGGAGMAVFYRRMAVLALVGLLHLMFLWSGDILLLYALLGMLLPLFRNVSDKKLLTVSVLLILFPIVTDTVTVVAGGRFDPSAPVIRATQYFNRRNGITDDNFGVWLLNGKSYADVFKFLVSGAFIRMQEFIEGNRVFKVLGLFLLGLYIGRNRIYANLESRKTLLKKVCVYGFAAGLPASVLYAWNSLNAQPLGLIGHSVAYAAGVVPLSLAYMSAISLLSVGANRCGRLFAALAAPGRMALTNYIGQSVSGIIIFYGLGFGLGATTGLAYVEMIAAGVFAMQVLCSCAWLRYMQFGPLEWIWRMFTYGKRLGIRKINIKG
ncbi:MAG: DUF418 domain-containing protein [Prevotellaceae bacterium]|jgi:uncharacterized protein|nr:DUF418 domain-containing protein [Prevotellaceae bacterium]